jgi:hypothetical protein
MNTPNFDEKGCLKPYSIIKTDLTTFRETFVFNEHRLALFDNYESFNVELQNLISCPSIQWIGGSFVTLKESPKDIDTVTFLPFDIFDKNRKELRKFEERCKKNKMDSFLNVSILKIISNIKIIFQILFIGNDCIANTLFKIKLFVGCQKVF